MPIRGPEADVEAPAVLHRLLMWLQGHPRGSRAWSQYSTGSGSSAATIGNGNGHAARGQVADTGDRIAPAPGPGCAGDAEPMVPRQYPVALPAGSSVWGRVCGCAHC